MFTALRDLFYNLFPINLPGIWWILSEPVSYTHLTLPTKA